MGMNEHQVDQQIHGYRYGHELLASSLKLDRASQDVVDRLSDLSGPLRPGETFEPYLTAYPLPTFDYFVLARTWQDAAAPRAGCVLTRSLLVRMEIWEAVQSPVAFVSLLRPVDRTSEQVERITIDTLPASLRPVDDPRLGELVEALFLENRQPTVMFDAPQAELISLRLLTALWPALRRTFSICTFSLAPRTVTDARSFDLQFAPKGARTRFSEWSGRRIEAADSSSASARHRWTAATTRQIFTSAEPSLIALDTLGALKLDRRGDESALRLSLLWNELLDKSEHSPAAVLGLLDILSSQGSLFDATSKRLTPLIEKSIDSAVQQSPIEEAWSFLSALVGKFVVSPPPKAVAGHLRRAAFSLTKKSPEAAISFLEKQSDQARSPSSDLVAGAGNGLAAVGIEAISAVLTRLPASMLLFVLAFSRRFALLTTQSVGREAAFLPTPYVARAFDSRDNDLRTRGRRNLLPGLVSSAHTPFLEVLLKDASPSQLARAVRQIWKTTKFSVPEFDECFRLAARSEEDMLAVRHAVLAMEETSSSDRFLVSTLRLDQADVRWLCAKEHVHLSRARVLLTKLLAQSDDNAVHAIARQREASDLIVELLRMESSHYGATQVARLLVAGRRDVDELLELGPQLLMHTEEPIRSQLSNAIFFRGLAEGGTTTKRALTSLLNIDSLSVDALQVVQAATPANAGVARLSDNLIFLGDTRGTLRQGALSHIDVLSERLVNKRGEPVTASAMVAWADLISEARAVNHEAQSDAAAAVLPYALRLTRAAASPLIVVAFPIVYEQLKAGNEPSGLFTFFLFADWDRCRTARDGLVDAFMRSSWPPSDLLLAAIFAGDAQRVLKRVSKEPHGGEYLRRIETDASRVPEAFRHEFDQQLARFSRDVHSSYGSE